MRTALLALALCAATTCGADAPMTTPDAPRDGRQITFAPKNHDLDQNDNVSPDGRLVVYDTRETVGPGIDNNDTIEAVDIETGAVRVLYRPAVSVTGSRPAPGIGAVSFSPVEARVAFIHGPLVHELDTRGPYAKPNRTGASVADDGSGAVTWLDARDTARHRDTTPGAHRGGTHRHEYSGDGRRIGFTYDDALMPEYERTIGYMEPHAKAPAGATHWFAVLVRPVPRGTSKPGEIERALGDSWVGREGRMRAFIGTVRNDDGTAYEDSLFVADVPATVDIATSDSGSATRYPAPPQGVTVRRLTHAWAGGIVRGAPDGSRIAYYAKDGAGTQQVFLIASDGSDRSEDPAKRPVQATRFEHGAEIGVRWHPSGNALLVPAGDGLAAVCVEPGPRFGETAFLTPHGDGVPRTRACFAPDGAWFVYNRPVPMRDAAGKPLANYAGLDFLQVFMQPWPADPRPAR